MHDVSPRTCIIFSFIYLLAGTPVSSTNKTDHYDITEIVLKVALNTIEQTNMK